MSAPISDDENSDYSKFAPKRLREQLPMPAARHLYPAPTVPSSSDVDQDRRTMSELAPWPEQVREPPPRRLSGLRLIGRTAVVSTFAALVALLTILAKPLWQSERIPLNAGSQASQASKPSDRLTAIFHRCATKSFSSRIRQSARVSLAILGRGRACSAVRADMDRTAL